MKQHKLYTSISALSLICFATVVAIFKHDDWYWVLFLVIGGGGYLMRVVAEFLDARALAKKNIADRMLQQNEWGK